MTCVFLPKNPPKTTFEGASGNGPQASQTPRFARFDFLHSATSLSLTQSRGIILIRSRVRVFGEYIQPCSLIVASTDEPPAGKSDLF